MIKSKKRQLRKNHGSLSFLHVTCTHATLNILVIDRVMATTLISVFPSFWLCSGTALRRGALSPQQSMVPQIMRVTKTPFGPRDPKCIPNIEHSVVQNDGLDLGRYYEGETMLHRARYLPPPSSTPDI
jgi:hypothetical protein